MRDKWRIKIHEPKRSPSGAPRKELLDSVVTESSCQTRGSWNSDMRGLTLMAGLDSIP